MTKKISILTVAASLLWLGGCASLIHHQQHYQNSSIVDFLYPKSERHEAVAQVPRLELPLRVGVAFTPDRRHAATGLTEAKKVELMQSVSRHFEALPFVEAIEIVPSGYLRPGGSFENLDQLQRMFAIDVIALVSYDQARFTDEGLASLAYWTVVGAYVVPAEKNSTHTMLEAVVYDIDSRKMLFRAPGTSLVKSRATYVNLPRKLREDSVEGFAAASEDLAGQLQVQLDLFQERIERAPGDVEIVRSEGYDGSGSSELGFLILAGIVALQGLKRW